MLRLINVSIVGTGQTKFGRHTEYDLRELFTLAANEAVAEAGITTKDVQALFVGNLSADLFNRQCHIAPLVADFAGMKGVPATKCEAACASSATALRAAIFALEAGLYDVVMAGGVEKMTDLSTAGVVETLASAADQTFEASAGLTFPGVFAVMAVAHMRQFGTTREQLAAVAIKNHHNAVSNPLAQFQQEVTLDKVLCSRMVAWPLALFDCSPISDGAAAVVLVRNKDAHKYTDAPVRIVGSGQASGSMNMSDREHLHTLQAAKKASAQAYKQAKLAAKDIDFAEVHDCFTIAEIIATEDLGFFKPGEGGPAVEQGRTQIGAEKPINTSGGLKAKGHPVGATGVAQVIELYHQLRNEAGKRQVPNASVGLAHNVGGTGATCCIHICKRW